MEGLHTVRDLLRRRDFMTKVDMSDYFFHLPIKPEDRKYFRFMWQGKKYQCTAMPFGLAPDDVATTLESAVADVQRAIDEMRAGPQQADHYE